MSVDPVGGPAQAAPRSVEEERVRKTAEDFTAMLATAVVKSMFDTIENDASGDTGSGGMFGNGPGSDIYRGFAEQTFAAALAKGGAANLTDQIAHRLAPATRPAPGKDTP